MGRDPSYSRHKTSPLTRVTSFSRFRFFEKLVTINYPIFRLKFVINEIFFKKIIIINYQFLDGNVPRTNVYGVIVSQLIRFAKVCSNISNFNNKNTCMKLLYCGKAIGIINFVKHLRDDCLTYCRSEMSSSSAHIEVGTLLHFS